MSETSPVTLAQIAEQFSVGPHRSTAYAKDVVKLANLSSALALAESLYETTGAPVLTLEQLELIVSTTTPRLVGQLGHLLLGRAVGLNVLVGGPST
jgi:hypothetical protein